MRNCIKLLLQHWVVTRTQRKKITGSGYSPCACLGWHLGEMRRSISKRSAGEVFEGIFKPMTLSAELPSPVMANKLSSLCSVLIFFI